MKEQNKKYLNIKNIKKQVKGITLIALVVTIIVLLILAGVALNLTIGQNGVFQKAQDAANTWRNAEQNEQLALKEMADSIVEHIYNTGKTVAEAKEKNKFFENDTTIKDDLENEVRIPKGFKIAGDSGTKVEEGIVIEDKDGNQFVWIPAKTEDGVIVHTEAKGDVTIVYRRTDYGLQNGSYSSYSETLPIDEADSVNANGGYYIGRFEAGDKESTEAKTMRTLSSLKTNTVTIKKGQAPYNILTMENCKSLAEGMSKVQGYSAKTKLISSYAWDTAISLIQITNETYGNNSKEGNYKDIRFDYTDIKSIKQTKNNNSAILVPTGQTTAVCNIYDMGGNLYEYTTESYSEASDYYALRGGDYYGYSVGYSAGYRHGFARDGNNIGFRVTLYL